MATIVNRATKGSALTHTEMDDNFANLNTDKAELSGATFTGTVNLTSTFQVGGVAVTLTAAEFNYLDITTLGTGAASKAVVLDVGDDYTWPAAGVLTYGVLNDGTTALTATVAEINTISDYTTTAAEVNAICDGKVLASTDNVIDNFPVGTLMLFQQTAAPTGWTKQTTHNDKAFRVVSGTASSGGSVAFSTAMASQGVAGTNAAVTLTAAQSGVGAHTHGNGTVYSGSTSGGTSNIKTVGAAGTATTWTTDSKSANATDSHTHGFTGTAIDMDVQYVDLIIAAKA